MTLADDTPSNPTILLIGPAGSGKTTFMARFGRVLIIDIDKNLNGPTKVLRKEQRDLSQIEYMRVDVDANGVALPPLQQYQRFNEVFTTAAQRDDLDAIGISSTTTLAILIANEVRRLINKPESYAFEVRDWGSYLRAWQQLITKCRCLTTPIIVDGHWEGDKNQVTGAISYALAISGKAAEQLPALFSDVLRFSVDNELVQGKLVTQYNIRSIQETLYPGVKAALDVPEKFLATQEWADKMRAQFPKKKTAAIQHTT